MSPRRTRLTMRERVWLPLEYIRTVGPLRGVTADGLRAALLGLHAADPAHHAVSRLDRDNARWVTMTRTEFAAYVQDAVTEVNGADADFDAMTRRLHAEPRGHHPVRILVGGDTTPAGCFVALKVAHAYGDADPVNRLLRELVLAAAQGRAAAFGPVPGRRLLVTKALWAEFGRRPGRWKSGLRITRAPAAVAAETVAWQPDLAVETARSAEVLAKMRVWRDANAPGVSTAAITFAAFATALTRLGIGTAQTGAVFLADARRYLPKGTVVDGNFCWGQYIAPVDLADPRAVQQALKAELSTGRILTMMALREIRVALSAIEGLPAPYPARIPRDRRPELTLSNQGRHDLLADLPWAGGPEVRVNHSVPTLSGPTNITLTTSEMAGVLHLEATFHSSTFDRALVARAIALVCEDPAALLSPAVAEAAGA
ncbi:MAG: hypothetical protein QOI74_1272 [Micromonosporaceae bacterium]|nr:hypothetical protein [Micromonosporaceae bacterium]